MKPIPLIGQTLYSLNVNNAARRQAQELTPVTVVSVGRKYFEACRAAKHSFPTKYHLDTWREKTEYSPDSELYESPKQWEETKLAKQLSEKICHAFQHGSNLYKLPLESLKQIAALIPDK